MPAPASRAPLVAALVAGVALNLAIGFVAFEIGLNFYLDAIGTIAVTLLCGWRAGLVVGVASSLLGYCYNPALPWFTFSQITIAAVAGMCADRQGFKNVRSLIASGVIIAAAAAFVSAPAAALAFGKASAFWPQTLENYRAYFASFQILSELIDKILQCFVANALVMYLPHSLRARFNSPRSELAVNDLL